MALMGTRPSVPLSQSVPSGNFYKPLILLHQRADRLNITVTENWPVWSHGPQPCLTQWNFEPCRGGPLKMDGSWWRVLTKCSPLEKGRAKHFSILALRTPWIVWSTFTFCQTICWWWWPQKQKRNRPESHWLLGRWCFPRTWTAM